MNLKKNTKLIDARNKIIQKNRLKIRDAREKLMQNAKVTDARLRILKKRKKPFSSVAIGEDLGRQPTRRPQRSLSSYPPAPPPPHIHRGFESMEIDDMRLETPTSYSLRRTVKNDMAMPIPSSIPPFPNFSRAGRKSPSFYNTSDPFDCYEVPIRRPTDVSEPMNIQRKIFNIDANEIPRKGILRTSQMLNPTIQRRYVPDENSSLSFEMRSRLERAPDPNESSGIFSRSAPTQTQSSNGYRIVVSNLHASVSQGDIKELFEDIGELMEARLVRPGIAEVIFKTLQDAEEAVDTYHNRHLDGQPMKCLLVHPRSSSKPTAPALKPPPTQVARPNSKPSSKTPLEIDIDALHKVLFRRT